MKEPNESFAKRINRDLSWIVEFKDFTRSSDIVSPDLVGLSAVLLRRREGQEMVGYITGIMVSYLKELGISAEELTRRINGKEY